jgi:hypothetical protein
VSARLIVERYRSVISIPVQVQGVAEGIVRVFSGRPLAVGLDAQLVSGSEMAAGMKAWARVSRCERLPTGLYELSLVTQAATLEQMRSSPLFTSRTSPAQMRASKQNH